MDPRTPIEGPPATKLEEVASHLRFFEERPDALRDATNDDITTFLRGLRRQVEAATDDGKGSAPPFDYIDEYGVVYESVKTVNGYIRQAPARAGRLWKDFYSQLVPWVEDGLEKEKFSLLQTGAPTPVPIPSDDGSESEDEASEQLREESQRPETPDHPIPEIVEEATPTPYEYTGTTPKSTGRRNEWELYSEQEKEWIRQAYREDVHDSSNDPGELLFWFDIITPERRDDILRRPGRSRSP